MLVFINVTLEVRHHFQGPVLSHWGVSDAEWYAYSAAWLGLAGVLLALGIRGQSAALRYGSLGVLVLTVGKVFLFDMAALTGLYRADSFAGLGLGRVAVGFLYERFVFSAPPKAPALLTVPDHLFQSLRTQKWDKARELIDQCRKLSGASQKLYDLHLKRLDYFQDNPPGENWDGAFRPILK